MKNHRTIDFQHDDFDPYRCWEDADCEYVEEVCIGNPEDDDFEEYLQCCAPYGFACPLYLKYVSNDLKRDTI